MQTSETDDVYFSSSDKVTYVEPTYEQRSETTREDRGEYQSSSEDITERVSDPETYQDDRRTRRNNNDPYQYSYYDAPFGNPYYAYSPYYSPSRYYSRAMMYDPWYDPFYDPFYRPMVVYDPFWPRPMYSGVMISIGLGWGNPWGYGYNPYRYGYGYNPYRYGGGFYDGFYRGDVYARKVAYGRRNDRSTNVGVGAASRTGARDSRNNVSTQSTRNSRTAPDGVIRSSRSSDGTAYPTRRRTDSSPARVEGTQQNSNSRSSEGQSAPPVRRRRDAPEASTQSESRPRVQPRTSYEPSRTSEPSRSSYEPSRSSSSSSSSGSSGSSSSGSSSSGSSRRGRN
ncbi:hypothetical protein GCM10023183_29860 [Nibribacter koreensis]|uniref:Uncharacterized protein n=1 Tax=Nibribacter koreensis TaxID=1084519 RepID=A0ABP8FUL4_9BACT